MAATDTLTPMADLAGRWGITANTVSRRLSFRGIKPIRQGNYRFLDPEQLALAEQLQQHILSGKPMEDFPRPNSEGRLVARQVEPSGLVAPQVTAADLATALAAALTPPADPLRRARALADAAELGVALSSPELAEVVGAAPSTVSSWPDGHSPRPGFTLHRQKMGAAVWWTVERQGTGTPVRAIASASGRSVGFASCLTVEAVCLPYFNA
jgi:hypothetical protein